MEAGPNTKTVRDLLDLRKATIRVANLEYQRGTVWTRACQKRLAAGPGVSNRGSPTSRVAGAKR